MTHSEYVAYFEGIAQSHVDIGNGTADGQFLNINLFDNPTEKPTGLKWKEGKFALVLLDPEFTDDSVNHDQRLWNADCEFWILKPTGRENSDAINAVKNDALVVCKEVLAKMTTDSDGEVEPLHWLHGLIDGSWVVTKIGPMWDGCYGYRVIFNVRVDAQADFVPNPAKWV